MGVGYVSTEFNRRQLESKVSPRRYVIARVNPSRSLHRPNGYHDNGATFAKVGNILRRPVAKC
jgi:hypothetical protein